MASQPGCKQRGFKLAKGFTLIELLVVIAIIGILAGLTAVGLSSATDSARVAKSKKFSSAMKSSMLYSITSEWRADDDSGNTVKDSWGASDCDLTGHAPSWAPDNRCVEEGCLQYNGSTQYLNCGNNPSLAIDSKSFTIEAWFKSETTIATGGRYTIMATYSPGWIMDLVDDGGIEGYRFYNGSIAYKYNIPGGEIPLAWTQWVVVRDASLGTVRTYINGELKQTWNMAAIAASSNPVLIGKRTDGSYFKGFIDTVRIYNKALNATKIKDNYLAEAGRYSKR